MSNIMSKFLRKMTKAGLARPLTPSAKSYMPAVVTRPGTPMVREQSYSTKPKKNPINCACGGHPWPEDEVKVEAEKKKDCDFNFRKLEVNPYDIPCDCKDPPPSASCADAGKPKEVCCRSTRQYGCFCEEEEESCEEEEEEEVVGEKMCDLDFKKLEVNPYDEPCDCHDPPPAASCADLPREDVCCRTPKPFGCVCEAYEEPGLECLKQKAPAQKKVARECNKKKAGTKCL